MSNLIKKDYIDLYIDGLGNNVRIPVLSVGDASPHVVMVALQHGQEIIGLDSALKVLEMQDRIIGKITLITIANQIGFLESSRLNAESYGDSSGQISNMNRLHPGISTGNLSERVNLKINDYIKSIKPDFVIDLHSYASQSVPHVIVDSCDQDTQATIVQWAKASNCPWYMDYQDETLKKQNLDNALSAFWANSRVPAITIELGPIRAFSTVQSKRAVNTLLNSLIAINAFSGETEPTTDMANIDFENNIYQRVPLVNDGNGSGYLRPLVSIGDKISKGQPLAEVVMLDGVVSSKIFAPVDGYHFIWSDEARVLPGSRVGVVIQKLAVG